MSSNFIQMAVAALGRTGTIKKPAAGQTRLLVHMDAVGADATGRNVGYNNGVVRNTDVKMFGAASSYHPGGGNIYIPGQTADMLGASDFTVEAWVYMPNLAALPAHTIVQQNGQGLQANGFHFAILSNGSITVGNMTNDALKTPPGVIKENEWQHVAATRIGAALFIWHNGTLVASGNTASAINANIDPGTYIGYGQCVSETAARINTTFFGYIDEVRIVKGLAVYTENFTPQDTPFVL